MGKANGFGKGPVKPFSVMGESFDPAPTDHKYMMKKFSDLIVESKSAPLYHGTPVSNVHTILHDGHLRPSDSGHVSFTRSKKYVESGHGSEAYFKFDQEKLAHRHKITPTDWHMGGSVHDKHHEDDMREPAWRRSEAEEVIKGRVPIHHATELVMKREHYHELTQPETDNEREFHHEVKKDPSMKWLYHGLLHKDRVKQAKQFHAALKKHNIKLTLKD